MAYRLQIKTKEPSATATIAPIATATDTKTPEPGEVAVPVVVSTPWITARPTATKAPTVTANPRATVAATPVKVTMATSAPTGAQRNWSLSFFGIGSFSFFGLLCLIVFGIVLLKALLKLIDYANGTHSKNMGKPTQNGTEKAETEEPPPPPKPISVADELRKERPYSDGVSYEQYVGKRLLGMGFEDVYTTKASGDHGVDLLAVEPNGNKWAIQCKYYSNAVSVKAVQEAYSGKTIYDCDKAVVITNSIFTKQARDDAEKLGVELIENFT